MDDEAHGREPDATAPIGLFPAPRPSTLPGREWARPLALLIAIVLLLDVGRLVTRPDPDGPSREDLGRVTAFALGEAMSDELAWAKEVPPAGEALGPGWVVDTDQAIVQSGPTMALTRDPALAGIPECDGELALGRVAQASRDLSSESGVVSVVVYAFPDEAAAVAGLGVLAGPPLRACVRGSVTAGLAEDPTVDAASIRPGADVPLAAPVDGDVVAVRLPYELRADGDAYTLDADLAFVRRGRAVAMVLLLVGDGPGQPSLQSVSELVAARMGAGPPA